MQIINKVCLPYKIIGEIIDNYIDDVYEETCYVGLIDCFEFMYKGNNYKCQVRYLKKDVEFKFVDIEYEE